KKARLAKTKGRVLFGREVFQLVEHQVGRPVRAIAVNALGKANELYPLPSGLYFLDLYHKRTSPKNIKNKDNAGGRHAPTRQKANNLLPEKTNERSLCSHGNEPGVSKQRAGNVEGRQVLYLLPIDQKLHLV